MCNNIHRCSTFEATMSKACVLVLWATKTPQHLFQSSLPDGLTSITIMSLELCLWTLGCWTLTATVLPSWSTALWTWAKEAAPWGFSSKETNNSDSCRTEIRMGRAEVKRGNEKDGRERDVELWVGEKCNRQSDQVYLQPIIRCCTTEGFMYKCDSFS